MVSAGTSKDSDTVRRLLKSVPVGPSRLFTAPTDFQNRNLWDPSNLGYPIHSLSSTEGTSSTSRGCLRFTKAIYRSSLATSPQKVPTRKYSSSKAYNFFQQDVYSMLEPWPVDKVLLTWSWTVGRHDCPSLDGTDKTISKVVYTRCLLYQWVFLAAASSVRSTAPEIIVIYIHLGALGLNRDAIIAAKNGIEA